jgi:hypothetical protein
MLNLIYKKATLTEIFNQISTTEVEEVRKRAIRFLTYKIPLLDTSGQQGIQNASTDTVAGDRAVLTKDVENFLIKLIKQVLGI